MASTSYHHGSRINETTNSAKTFNTTSPTVIGMVCTAADADATVFPLDTPVLFTRPQDAIAKAGTSGTLAASLQAIADQSVVCPIVVVRTTEGADEAATTANIIGTTNSQGKYTGLKALLAAKTQLGVVPRILGVPGHDTQAVTTALVTVAQQLRGFAYATCDDCQTISDAIAYREDFGARELMLIWPDFTRFDTTAKATAKALTVAYALGLRALIDQKYGVQKSLSNVPVNGVTGISADVFFQYLGDGGTDADLLNEAGITTLVNHNGFRFWGSRTCDEGDYIFEPYTRVSQVVADTIGEGVFEYTDKPLHASLAKDIIASINAELSKQTNAGVLLGGKCWFDASKNAVSQLKAGGLTISYDYTVPPPLEDLTLEQTFTDTYFADLVAGITATSGQ